MMKEVNEALVAKLAWKVLKNEDSLWVQMPRGKYLRNNNF